MNTHSSPSETLLRINRELHRAAGGGHGLSLAETGPTVAISDACSTYRRIRFELDGYLLWLQENSCDLVPLFKLLIQVSDAACRVRSAES